MSQTRVPETIAEFNTYISTGNVYLQAGTPVTNLLRLGLTAGNGSDWSDAAELWADTYARYADPTTSTSIVKENLRHRMHDFKVFANPLLNIIAASPAATDADAAVFNLVLDRNHANPTHATTPITVTVMAEIGPLGTGDVIVTCRTSTDSKNASKLPEADSIQVSYKLDGAPPAGVDDGTHKEIFTRARFIMHLGSENAGKKLYVFLRWYNTKHPQLAGPWGQMIVTNLA